MNRVINKLLYQFCQFHFNFVAMKWIIFLGLVAPIFGDVNPDAFLSTVCILSNTINNRYFTMFYVAGTANKVWISCRNY